MVGDPARRHPAAAADAEAEPHRARHPDRRARPSSVHVRGGSLKADRHPARDAGPAVGTADPASRHPPGGSQPRRRQRQCLQRARAAMLPSDHAHRRGRLSRAPCSRRCCGRNRRSTARRRPDAADLRGRQTAGQSRPAEGQQDELLQDLPQGGDLGLRRRGERARRHPPDRTARALQRQVVASSRQAFNISEERFREGTIDLVTLLQTQQSLYRRRTRWPRRGSRSCRRSSRFIRRWGAAG